MLGFATTSLLCNPSSIISFNVNNPKIGIIYKHPTWRIRSSFRGWSSQQQSPLTEFNLYELLGVDATSDRSQIKEAYRALQKRCHPDIAGPPGHDMAILLNEAYALLCDPVSRMAYDKELAKLGYLQGYTGKPIYSVWLGSESEERAVFVDEVKCVGCLKCALFAEKTFAVESVYGRARVVAQWADPESNIQQAIGACPVDCISIVEKSDLPALEFIMSKQPRGRVRIGGGNTVGVRTADVFDEVDKFKSRYPNLAASKQTSKEKEDHGTSKIVSAIQAIQMMSNWLYWQSPTTDVSPPTQPGTKRYAGPSVKKLKAAVAARNQPKTTPLSPNSTEYWEPLPVAPSPDSNSNSNSNSEFQSTPIIKPKKSNNVKFSSPNKGSSTPLRWGVPIGVSVVAATLIRLQLGDSMGGGLEGHVGGSFALAIVNSSWMQVALAGVTWYLIGSYVVELVEALRRK